MTRISWVAVGFWGLIKGLCIVRSTHQRCLPSTHGRLGMPSLQGHHGGRHHIITAMRTKEVLKLYHSHFIRDPSLAFNSSDLDIENTPSDGIAEILYQLRASHPTDDAFSEATHKWSIDLDAQASSAYHQNLVDGYSPAAATVFLSRQGVKLSFAIYPDFSQLNASTTLLSNKEYILKLSAFFLLSPFRTNLMENKVAISSDLV